MLGLLLTACPSDEEMGEGPVSTSTPSVLRDTTGAQFELVNGNPDELAAIDIEPPPACEGIERATEFEFWMGDTGLAMICLLSPDTGAPEDVFCRPIACDVVSDCTAGLRCVDGTCRCTGGACGYADGHGRVDADELLALCLAHEPRTAMCPPSFGALEAYAKIGDACDEETALCTIPAACAP